MDGEEHEPDDLRVRLEWPDDPLVRAVDPPSAAETHQRVVALEKAIADLPASGADTASLEAAVVRLEYIAAETVQALRGIHDSVQRLADENRSAIDAQMASLRTAVMSMLASRAADEQKTIRNERDTLVGRVESVVAAMQTQTEDFARQISGELKALRRRLPMRASAGTGDDGFDDLEELVTRVADEVEIRVAAAVTPKSKPKSPRRASPR